MIQNPQEFIQKNLADNISYLQKHQAEIFEKISALESAIEQGHYQENYELVYENDAFDVLEKNTNTYLYDKSITKHTNLAAKSIDCKIEDNLFEGFHKQTISSKQVEEFKEITFKYSLSGFAPLLHYIEQNSSKRNTLHSLQKFIFFGVGLGSHIESIHTRITAKVYFIIEDDLELFRLSLFTTNYKKLAQDAQLIFSVFEDNHEFLKSAELFLHTQYYYNHYLKYFTMLNHNDEKSQQFHIAISSQAHLLFFYNALLVQYTSPLQYLQDDYKFLNKSLNFSTPAFKDKDFLLLAAGPSLQKNIKWLQKNHKKFIVVALSATLSYLEEHGITPNIITHLDAFENANAHFKKLKSFTFLKNSICFFSARIPKNITSLFDKQKLFFFENGTQYKDSSLKPSSPCIGSLSYQLLIILKAQNIYLLGLDLAIDNKSGATHISSHNYLKTLSTEENAFDNAYMTYKDSLFNIEGNFIKTVLVTPHFKTSIDSINTSTSILKQEKQDVYNLSDGAKFLQTISQEISLLHKSSELSVTTQEELLALCNLHSSSSLSTQELQNIEQKREHSQRIKKEILKYKNLDTLKKEEYISNLIDFTKKLSRKDDIKNYELSRVFDTYFKYILSFIVNFCNSQNFTQEHTKNIDNLLTKHLLAIVDYYYEKIKV